MSNENGANSADNIVPFDPLLREIAVAAREAQGWRVLLAESNDVISIIMIAGGRQRPGIIIHGWKVRSGFGSTEALIEKLGDQLREMGLMTRAQVGVEPDMMGDLVWLLALSG